MALTHSWSPALLENPPTVQPHKNFPAFYESRRGMLIGYWWGSQKERDHWEDQDVGGWTILKWFLER
jgi:hypothetical protein